jgi:hypothetical protein
VSGLDRYERITQPSLARVDAGEIEDRRDPMVATVHVSDHGGGAMRGVVAGGTGMLGRQVMKEVRRAGHDPISIDASATARSAAVIEVPMPGPWRRGMRDGSLLPNPGTRLGELTFEEWLATHAM